MSLNSILVSPEILPCTTREDLIDIMKSDPFLSLAVSKMKKNAFLGEEIALSLGFIHSKIKNNGLEYSPTSVGIVKDAFQLLFSDLKWASFGDQYDIRNNPIYVGDKKQSFPDLFGKENHDRRSWGDTINVSGIFLPEIHLVYLLTFNPNFCFEDNGKPMYMDIIDKVNELNGHNDRDYWNGFAQVVTKYEERLLKNE